MEFVDTRKPLCRNYLSGIKVFHKTFIWDLAYLKYLPTSRFLSRPPTVLLVFNLNAYPPNNRWVRIPGIIYILTTWNLHRNHLFVRGDDFYRANWRKNRNRGLVSRWNLSEVQANRMDYIESTIMQIKLLISKIAPWSKKKRQVPSHQELMKIIQGFVKKDHKRNSCITYCLIWVSYAMSKRLLFSFSRMLMNKFKS